MVCYDLTLEWPQYHGISLSKVIKAHRGGDKSMCQGAAAWFQNITMDMLNLMSSWYIRMNILWAYYANSAWYIQHELALMSSNLPVSSNLRQILLKWLKWHLTCEMLCEYIIKVFFLICKDQFITSTYFLTLSYLYIKLLVFFYNFHAFSTFAGRLLNPILQLEGLDLILVQYRKNFEFDLLDCKDLCEKKTIAKVQISQI